MDSAPRSQNGFLSSLTANDFELVRPHLRTADLNQDMVLVEVDEALKRAYIPHKGVISLVVNFGMWLERFVIIVTSLNRDFLPSSWGMYYPTRWDFMTYFGTIGLFLTLFFLFIRFVPMISMFEVRTLLPQAKVAHGEEH